MFQEEFQGVEGAKRIVLEILSRKGLARWSDFEKQLPKSTVSRVLKELEREGLVVKKGRYYTLVSKKYDTLIRVDYAPSLCELIPGCSDSEKLAEDLIKEVGDGILKIEEVHSRFVNDRLPSLVESGIIGGVYSLLLKTVYQDKAFFSLILMEAIKLIMMKKLIDEGCNDIFNGLPKEYADFLKNIVESNAKNTSEFFGAKIDEMLEPLMKLREVLIKHGYRGVIRIRAFLTTEVTIEVEEMLSLALISILSWYERIGVKNIANCTNTLFNISSSLVETGCRELGTRERDSLIKNCKEVVSSPTF